IALAGGASVTIAPAQDHPFGMQWIHGSIVFELSSKGILRVSDNGGTPELLVPLKAGELIHGPQMLPDGETVLYTFAAGNAGNVTATWDSGQIVAHSLRTGQRKTLIEGGMEGRYLPTGHIV